MFDLVLLAHAFLTVMVFSIVLYVHIVHYPLLSKVGKTEFKRYQKQLVNKTTVVVFPLMVLEALGALLLCVWTAFAGEGMAFAFGGVLLLLWGWGVTFFFAVPQHQNLLERGFNESFHRALLHSNLYRIALWGLRSALLLFWAL